MNDSIFHNQDLITPSYVYDQSIISKVLDCLEQLKTNTGLISLYSMKSACMFDVMACIKPGVSGFSCSSLFEVLLAKELLDEDQTIHIATPGYRNDEWDRLIGLCDFITLNSINQWKHFADKINKKASCGIRINPELSFVKDKRYDPCRPDSKLGVTLQQLAEANTRQKLDWKSVEGVHIHNNCESVDFNDLKISIEHVMSNLSQYRLELKWINLGGGYLFNNQSDLTPLEETVNQLVNNNNLIVYFEPGKAITGNAGHLVSSVIDLIEYKNKTLAVLDTTVNHMPEVFEYQYQPKVMNAVKQGGYNYHLVGCSCLSGDLFGDYFFDEPLEIGSRIVFENVGAYMQVKANMFNGINLPSTYLFDGNENYKLIKQHDYKSFRSRL